MRTTIDLDPDVDARLRELARQRQVSLREMINSLLRSATHPLEQQEEPYVVPARWLGVRPGINLDKALALASDMEDEEILRKIALGK